VTKLEVFIFKFVAINGLSSSAVVVCEIASLEHEVRNYTVEPTTSVSKSMLARCELTKVTSCLGDCVVEELEHNAP